MPQYEIWYFVFSVCKNNKYKYYVKQDAQLDKTALKKHYGYLLCTYLFKTYRRAVGMLKNNEPVSL